MNIFIRGLFCLFPSLRSRRRLPSRLARSACRAEVGRMRESNEVGSQTKSGARRRRTLLHSSFGFLSSFVPALRDHSSFTPALLLLCLLAFTLQPSPALAADTLTWRTNENRVTADLKASELFPLLEHIASTTGWKIYVEPGTARKVSTKFK